MGTRQVHSQAMRRRRSESARASVVVAIGATVVLGGCVVIAHRGTRAEVSSPPPPPAYEAPVACDAGYARVAGHWQWNGYQYVWLPQRCVYRPGFRYEEGGYFACDDGYCYREGTWVHISFGR